VEREAHLRSERDCAGLNRPLEIAEHPAPGVNLVGFLEGELGLGEVARKLGRALERAEIPFAPIVYRGTPSRQQHPLEWRGSHEARFDTNVICLNADHLHDFVAGVGVDFFAGRYSIGVLFWETSVSRRRDLESLRFLDEVWVASEYVRDVVAAETDVPVRVVRLPIEEPASPSLSRSDLGLPAEFTFLFNFDFISAERKNPIAVVEAFKRAFTPGEGPVLVLKTINGNELKPRSLEELRSLVARRPDIRLRDGYVSAALNDALKAACDCYVSLHRSEGFGLTLAEAMAHGKPVIATSYSGNMEFMDENNSYLIPYRLMPIPPDWWAYSPGAVWADPDVGAAAHVMRGVYDDQDEARARGERGRQDILRRFSPEQTAEFIGARVSEGRARRAAMAGSGTDDPRRPILVASQELARGVGGRLASPVTRGRAGVLRRLLARALWPQLAEQHRFEEDVLNALTRAARQPDDFHREAARGTVHVERER
jgi:glycosyltransferase involved in cell wall biosynthesis